MPFSHRAPIGPRTGPVYSSSSWSSSSSTAPSSVICNTTCVVWRRACARRGKSALCAIACVLKGQTESSVIGPNEAFCRRASRPEWLAGSSETYEKNVGLCEARWKKIRHSHTRRWSGPSVERNPCTCLYIDRICMVDDETVLSYEVSNWLGSGTAGLICCNVGVPTECALCECPPRGTVEDDEAESCLLYMS